jgi:hypothetical protein
LREQVRPERYSIVKKIGTDFPFSNRPLLALTVPFLSGSAWSKKCAKHLPINHCSSRINSRKRHPPGHRDRLPPPQASAKSVTVATHAPAVSACQGFSQMAHGQAFPLNIREHLSLLAKAESSALRFKSSSRVAVEYIKRRHACAFSSPIWTAPF